MGHPHPKILAPFKSFQERHRHRQPEGGFPSDISAYSLLAKIGEGDGSVIYMATCDALESIAVALKSIDLQHPRASVLDEEMVLAHPNILAHHCFFRANGRRWIVMPFMSGGSLHTIVPMTFSTGLIEAIVGYILKETLQALCYMHHRGLVHGHIELQKILFDNDGNVKLLTSRSPPAIHGQLSPSSVEPFVIEQPYWVAPEVMQSERREYGPKADIWALGITAMEMFHGGTPVSLPPLCELITKRTGRVMNFPRARARERKNVSVELMNLVGSCLFRDPCMRPPSDELLQHPFIVRHGACRPLLAGIPQVVPPLDKRFSQMKECLLRSRREEGNCSLVYTMANVRRVTGWELNKNELLLDPVFSTQHEPQRPCSNDRSSAPAAEIRPQFTCPSSDDPYAAAEMRPTVPLTPPATDQ